jgi:membrane fusion protein, multidrug efflux system
MADQVQVHPANDVAGNEAPAAEASAPRASAPPEPRSPASRLRLAFLLLGVVAILLIAGFFVWRYLSTYESTDDAQVDGNINPISPRVSGYVTTVNIQDNQYVDKGAVLVQIDPRDYQVAVDHAKAELADAEATARAASLNVPVESVGTTSQVSSSEAQLAGTQAGVTAAKEQFDAARSQLLEAEANNARAQSDLTRYRQLVAKDEVSQQVYEQVDAAAKSSAAAVDAARAAAAGAEQQIAVAQGRLGQAEAALRSSHTGPQQVDAMRARAQAAQATAAQKRADLAQAELNLQYCTIVAPVSGVVNKNVEVGQNVQPGQTLASLVPLDDVWVTADFKETQLANMHPGQRATISVDAFSRKYDGHVESIAGAAGARFSLLPPENATGNYVKVVQRVPVKIVLEPNQNQDHRLRLGMSVEPKVWVK